MLRYCFFFPVFLMITSNRNQKYGDLKILHILCGAQSKVGRIQSMPTGTRTLCHHNPLTILIVVFAAKNLWCVKCFRKSLQSVLHDYPLYLVCPDVLSLVGELLSGDGCGSPNHISF